MLVDWINGSFNQELAVYEDEPKGTVLYASDGDHFIVINLDDNMLEQLIRALQTQLAQRRNGG